MFYRYKIWVRINDYQTAETIIIANSDYEAKILAEAQYGVGNILNYTLLGEVNEWKKFRLKFFLRDGRSN